MLSQLSDEEIKEGLAALNGIYQTITGGQLTYVREGLVDIKAHLNQLVEFSVDYDPSIPGPGSKTIAVEYDFETLHGNQLLRSQFAEVVDSHHDFLGIVQYTMGYIMKLKEHMR